MTKRSSNGLAHVHATLCLAHIVVAAFVCVCICMCVLRSLSNSVCVKQYTHYPFKNCWARRVYFPFVSFPFSLSCSLSIQMSTHIYMHIRQKAMPFAVLLRYLTRCFLGHFVGREKFTIQCMNFSHLLHHRRHHQQNRSRLCVSRWATAAAAVIGFGVQCSFSHSRIAEHTPKCDMYRIVFNSPFFSFFLNSFLIRRSLQKTPKWNVGFVIRFISFSFSRSLFNSGAVDSRNRDYV